MAADWWRGRRVLITGHTGFKGSWLSLCLARHGALLYGLALAPTPGEVYDKAEVANCFEVDKRGDVRDLRAVEQAFEAAAPEVVFHLAAQPLVRASYEDPTGTFETNVMGTAHVILTSVRSETVRSVVSVTTDKVYRNVEQQHGYRESDPLGGDDPYSASKACAEIVTHSIARSFGPPTGVRIATARAGNVLGGGDVSRDRLFPDIVHSLVSGTPLKLRYPNSVRPWQHVLDPLAGYIALARHLVTGRSGAAYNFGPDAQSELTVAEITDLAFRTWGREPDWSLDRTPQPHEAGLLTLDATLAMRELAWRPRLDARSTVEWTLEYAREVQAGASPRAIIERQIARYERLQV